MRPDGTRVKDLPPLVAAIPYIMPKRYDAWNSVSEIFDEEIIKDFIRTHRRAGVRLNHMSVIISAYYKAVLRNPKLNYFVMNSRIYKRNHFCVSFVILKKLADGSPDAQTRRALTKLAVRGLDGFEVSDLELRRVFITHSGLPEETVQKAVETVQTLQPFDEICVTRAGCTVSSHCGPGTIGVLYIRKAEA